ncbi:MAG: aldehyde dehydrogenase family protein, partial [Gluconacetobacter diazotrophicus]|nr:aldehyde dehydrogenase family protein [Gluconacetobacter diazotrophicus]
MSQSGQAGEAVPPQPAAQPPLAPPLQPTGTDAVRAMAEQARAAARTLLPASLERRNAALAAVADLLEDDADWLLEANGRDLALAERLVEAGELSAANFARLPLSTAKLAEMAAQVRAVRQLPDPLGRALDRIELDSGLDLEKRSVPLGVLAVIFEARPDAVTQIAALALKSGNAVMLKPGREVEHTAQALVEVIRRAISRPEAEGGAALPADAVQLILGRAAVAELLTLSSLVDLVIPRGSRALVEG